MSQSSDRAVAIVGVGAVLPDAPNAPAFWNNIVNKRYSIRETPPERWSIADYFDPDPAAPDKSLFQDRRLGAGLSVRLEEISHPAQGVRRDGRKPAVGRHHCRRGADRLRLSQPAAGQRAHGRDPGHGHGRRAALHYRRTGWPSRNSPASWQPRPSSPACPASVREAILSQWHARMGNKLPQITEDTMPGELANIVAGRVANVLNLRGPNFITDAACASSFAAINAAFEMLTEHHVDAVIAGGVDRNMGIASFVKFCKIGALSATGSRPFGEGADGFVMGEGSASFLLKRLSDAEKDGDKIYAVIRGVGGSSDGKGKGITAPNPIGQILSATTGLGKCRAGPGHGHVGGGPRHQHESGRCGRGREPDRGLRRRAPAAASAWGRRRATSAI